MPRLALATDRATAPLHADDAALPDAFAQQGVEAEGVVWSDPDVDWTAYDGVLLRTPWDYTQDVKAFLNWTMRLNAEGVPMLNPAQIVRWNADKRYLFDLLKDEVPLPPTRLAVVGSRPDLGEIAEAEGWDAVVVKPVVGAGAQGLRVFGPDAFEEGSAWLEQQLATDQQLLQPKLSGIEEEGEWSLTFLGGEHSHSVLKRAEPGDIRIQEEHGGSVEAVDETPPDVLAAAERVMDAVPWELPYARVDLVRQDGRCLLMELELIEPELFLRYREGSADRLAEAVTRAFRWSASASAR